jgi:hypothetical protein
VNPTKSRIIAALCAVLIAGAALALSRFRSHHRLGTPGLRLCEVALSDDKGKPATTNSIFLPERILDYSSQLLPVTREELEWLPKDTTYGRRFYKASRDGFLVQVSGVLMGTDRTSIHKPEYCLPAQGFHISRRTRQTLTIEKPIRYELPITRLDATREIQLENGTRSTQGAVYVYWFVSGSRLSNDHLQRMWWLASDLLRTGELQRWAYIGVLGVCAPGQQDLAFQRLEELIREMVPEFQTTTPHPPAPSTAATGLPAPTPIPPPLWASGAMINKRDHESPPASLNSLPHPR